MPNISEILENEDFSQVVSQLCVDTFEGREAQEYLDEYEGERTRRRTSVGLRKNKTIEVYSDTLVDDKGEPIRLEDKVVEVARHVTNFPKKVVRTSVAFMLGGDMQLQAETQDEGFEEFKDVWTRRLKMHSVLKKFARTVLSETKSAIVFYPYVSKSWWGEDIIRLKAQVLELPKSTTAESEFYPHFSDSGDMDGFIHKTQASIDSLMTDKVLIWTREKMITATQAYGVWNVTEADNPFGLIPVVYGDIFSPEWEEVAPMMDAREMRLSRTSDTNDYFGEPIMKTYGETNLPSKETAGKEIQFPMEVDPDSGKPYHGDAEFMSWQQSIESVKQELEETKNELFSGSSTPDLSFDSMKGIGNVSGVARRFMTLDAQIKASENMETFEPAIQRCVSVVSAGIGNITSIKHRNQLINNWITVSFDSILPKDPVEDAQVLNIAGGGRAFNSMQTLVGRSPLTPAGDIEDEIKRIEEDETRQAEQNSLGQTAFGEQ